MVTSDMLDRVQYKCLHSEVYNLTISNKIPLLRRRWNEVHMNGANRVQQSFRTFKLTTQVTIQTSIIKHFYKLIFHLFSRFLRSSRTIFLNFSHQSNDSMYYSFFCSARLKCSAYQFFKCATFPPTNDTCVSLSRRKDGIVAQQWLKARN